MVNESNFKPKLAKLKFNSAGYDCYRSGHSGNHQDQNLQGIGL
jgi:hypothetical protein